MYWIDLLFSSLQSFQNQLRSLEAQGSVQPLIMEKNRQLAELHDQLGKLQMQQKELAEEKVQCQRDAESGRNERILVPVRWFMEIYPFVGAAKELQNMNDIKNQRLQKLRSRDRETEKALVWLESHRDLFQEPIFAPVLVLVGEGKEF